MRFDACYSLPHDDACVVCEVRRGRAFWNTINSRADKTKRSILGERRGKLQNSSWQTPIPTTSTNIRRSAALRFLVGGIALHRRVYDTTSSRA